MKELNRDELIKILGGDDPVEPPVDPNDPEYWSRGRATSYTDFY